MALKFNTTNGSITLDAEDGIGNIDLSLPREGFLVPSDIGSSLQAYDVNTAKIDVAQTFTADQSFGNVTLTGYLRGGSSFVIDPAAHGDDTGTVVIAGNLQIDGTTTTINSTTLDVDDLNITIAKGAADSSAANGSGITVDGASATLSYSSSDDRWNFNKPLNSQLFATGTLGIQEVIEKATLDTSTSGTFNFDALTQAVVYMTANQSANRTLNFRGDASTTLDSIMSAGESMTFAIAATQGATAYYFSTLQVDGSSVTPKWVGGAPTEGNPTGIEVYTVTIIKTATSTFTVLAQKSFFE